MRAPALASQPTPTVPPRRVGLVAAGRTDVGRVRTHNEDAYLVAALGDDATVIKGVTATLTVPGSPALLIVADGVGGSVSGEIASLMATDTILIELRRRHERGMLTDVGAVEDAIWEAVAAANHVIHTYSTTNAHHRGMATTATVAVLYEGTLLIAQVGDSRAYLVHNGVARQLTKDQSLVQRLLDAGEITEAQAATSDRKNIILQALGSDASVTPDLYREQPAPGDVLILCSDGLSNYLSLKDFEVMAQGESDVSLACEQLVDEANRRGGHDNITVVAARFTSVDGTPEEVPPVPQGSTRRGLADRVRQWLQ